jgi:hypothetical protein
MKPLWVLINRARNPWKQPTAVQCEECGALCVSEEAWERHSMWHTALSDELMSLREKINSAGRSIKAGGLKEIANLIRQTTPDARSDSNYDRGMFTGRYRAIEQIESEAALIDEAEAQGGAAE